MDSARSCQGTKFLSWAVGVPDSELADEVWGLWIGAQAQIKQELLVQGFGTGASGASVRLCDLDLRSTGAQTQPVCRSQIQHSVAWCSCARGACEDLGQRNLPRLTNPEFGL